MTLEHQRTGKLTSRPGCLAWRGQLPEQLQWPEHMLLSTLGWSLLASSVLCAHALVQRELAAKGSSVIGLIPCCLRRMCSTHLE